MELALHLTQASPLTPHLAQNGLTLGVLEVGDFLDSVKEKNTSPTVGEIIDMIGSKSDSLSVMRKDSVVKQQIETRQKILGL